MRLRTMSLALAVMIMGCGDDLPTNTNPPDTVMTTEGYDKTCTMSADCGLVFTGSVCGCGCTQEAISVGEQSRYAAEQEEKRKACTDILQCQPCPDTEMADCMQGMCTVVAK